MTSADLLQLYDRDPRAAYYALRWQRDKIHPTEALRLCVNEGLMDPEDQDHGQLAGDTMMQLARDRGLDVDGSRYHAALHHAALADMIVTVLRSGGVWARPEDRMAFGINWQSGCFVDPSGVRLHRILLADRWSPDREKAERHSWRTIGEICAYGLPMTITVVLIGQRRDGRHSSPWSKGFLHPISRALRIRKRSGEKFDGNWKPIWREEHNHISRDKWLDAMKADRVMTDLVFDVKQEVPCPEAVSKIGRLSANKLQRLSDMQEPPEPNPSQCWGVSPCQFVDACWGFQEPSARLGFTEILPLP